jgi:hypothetical protein
MKLLPRAGADEGAEKVESALSETAGGGSGTLVRCSDAWRSTSSWLTAICVVMVICWPSRLMTRVMDLPGADSCSMRLS